MCKMAGTFWIHHPTTYDECSAGSSEPFVLFVPLWMCCHREYIHQAPRAVFSHLSTCLVRGCLRLPWCWVCRPARGCNLSSQALTPHQCIHKPWSLPDPRSMPIMDPSATFLWYQTLYEPHSWLDLAAPCQSRLWMPHAHPASWCFDPWLLYAIGLH